MLILLVACRTPTPVAPTPVPETPIPPTSVVLEITPEGGELEAFGVQLVVPAGVVEAPASTTLRLAEVDPPHEGLSQRLVFDPPVALTGAVEIRLPFEGEAADARAWEQIDGRWRPAPGEVADEVLVAGVSRLESVFVGLPGPAEEAFLVEAPAQVDLLIVMDDSLDPGATGLRNAFGNTVTELLAGLQGVDWHIGVTGTDPALPYTGYLRPHQGTRYVTPATADAAGVLAAMLEAENQGATETGRGPAFGVFETNADDVANQGFSRPAAERHVVFALGTEDQTQTPPLADFMSWAISSSPSPVTLHALAPPPPPGDCPGLEDPSILFSAYASDTGGAFFDVCDLPMGIGPFLQDVASMAGGRRVRVRVAEAHDPTSVEVEVDGTTWTGDDLLLLGDVVVVRDLEVDLGTEIVVRYASL